MELSCCSVRCNATLQCVSERPFRSFGTQRSLVQIQSPRLRKPFIIKDLRSLPCPRRLGDTKLSQRPERLSTEFFLVFLGSRSLMLTALKRASGPAAFAPPVL